MAVIILLAPATRIGYLLYPINFFVWAYLFRGRRAPTEARRRLPTSVRRGPHPGSRRSATALSRLIASAS